MKLSEAIRLGAAKRPQAFGAWFPYHVLYGFQSCALGAALEGIGSVVENVVIDHRFTSARVSLDPSVSPNSRVLELWPFPDHKIKCQYCTPRRDDSFRLNNLIMHFNDSHGWSRQHIADWLEESGLDLESVVSTGSVPEVPAFPAETEVPVEAEVEELVCV